MLVFGRHPNVFSLPFLPKSENKKYSSHLNHRPPILLSIAVLLIVQGGCQTNHDDSLGSMYGALVSGNGGGNGNGDDWGIGGIPPGAEMLTATIGDNVVFNCHVEFPDNYPVPYIVQWDKKGLDIPIFIWYDGYPTHIGDDFANRVSRVSNTDNSYGLASLNLTAIRESDRGWYNCRVYFLNRSPPPQNSKNITGSWYHLDVHAPPRFVHTSDKFVYTKIGKSIILHCVAEGTPTPEIIWYKGKDIVELGVTLSIVNDGTELRISKVREEDIGDYTCIAKNGLKRIHYTFQVLIAGSAVITTKPENMTLLEGAKAEFKCEYQSLPNNATVTWLRDGIPVHQISTLQFHVDVTSNGTLTIHPVAATHSGFYECHVSNGIGETQTASAFLNVEYPAEVTYTPTVQYLPRRLSGVVRCFIMSNPPIQFVVWTRDKHLLEPYEQPDYAVMSNGSLLIQRVKDHHQGMYTCTPYNVHGTKGASQEMQIIVKDPPKFDITPDPMYQSKLGSSLEIPCSASAPNGTTSPLITWQRKNGKPLPRDRVQVIEGTLFIENLHQMDYGEYECVASNEVATLIMSTKIIVEGTKPHAPSIFNYTSKVFSVTLMWRPGYSGGPDFRQSYVVWYRQVGESRWNTVQVTPMGSTRLTIRSLSPGKTYQFQVVGINELGEGHPSKIVEVTTKDSDTIMVPNKNARNESSPPITPPITPGASTIAEPDQSDIIDYSILIYPTDETGSTYIPTLLRPQGPKPGVPWNVTIHSSQTSTESSISWNPPLNIDEIAVAYYIIEYKKEIDREWKHLDKNKILPPATTYITKSLLSGKTYYFRIVAFTTGSNSAVSDEVKFKVPLKDKRRAVIAGLVGGILFFIVAIILSVCAVKICNRRKRRKQERAYNMVACRLTDARNGGQIPPQPQIPVNRIRNGAGQVHAVTSWLKKAYRWVGRAVGRFIIHLLDLRTRRHAIILSSRTMRSSRPGSISSITLSLADIDHHPAIRRHRYYPSTSQTIPARDVVDESSSDDGGFLAPRPLRYYTRGRRRFNLVFPGSFVPSSSLLQPSKNLVARPFSSSPLPTTTRSPMSSYIVHHPKDLSFNNLSSVARFPVLVQVHQPPYLWKAATTGHQYHPSDPTPPPWEAERIRDTLARDLEYLERQVPSFVKSQVQKNQQKALDLSSPLTSSSSAQFGKGSSGAVRFQESSSSGFHTGSKLTTSTTLPSGSSGIATGLGSGASGRDIFIRSQDGDSGLPTFFQPQFPPLPIPVRKIPPRTYENWPRREGTPPIYAMARSPTFEVEDTGPSSATPITVPVSEPSPGTRTLQDMSVDDPYEFDTVIPDTSPEISYPSPPQGSSSMLTSLGPSSSMVRFKRARDKYENMEARVAAMKEEFFEYRRRQKKRMESAC